MKIIAPKVNKGSIRWREYEGYPLCIEELNSAENVPTNARNNDLYDHKAHRLRQENWMVQPAMARRL